MDPGAAAVLSHRRFDVDEYTRMHEAEILSEDDRFELIDGEIVQMTPIGSRHFASVNRLNRLLVTALAGRGGSVMGLVTPPRAQMQGGATSTMFAHRQGAPTPQMRPWRRNPPGKQGLRPMAVSHLLDDVPASLSSLLLALTRKTYLPDPPHFHHGLLGERAIVSVQNPVHLDRFSMLQPDVVVLHPAADDYAGGLPKPEQTFLLIEVANTSLCFDRTVKVPLYAATGIPEVWIVDLRGGAIEVYRKPHGRAYGLRERVDEGSLAPAAFPELALAVEAILPPPVP